jgi:hypothetical protein
VRSPLAFATQRRMPLSYGSFHCWIAFHLCTSTGHAKYLWLVLSAVTFPSIWALCSSLTTRSQASKGSTVTCLALFVGGMLLTIPAFDSYVAGVPHLVEEQLRMGLTLFAHGDQFASDLIDLFRRARSVLPAARTITFLCSGNIVFLHEMLHDFDFPARKKITTFGGIVVAAIGVATACSAAYNASQGDRNVIFTMLALMVPHGLVMSRLPPRHEELFIWGTMSHLALMASYFAWLMGLTAVFTVSMKYSLLTWIADGLVSLVYLWAWLAPLLIISRCLKRNVIVEQPRMIRRRSF